MPTSKASATRQVALGIALNIDTSNQETPMGWASYEEDNASRFHQATVIRNKEHDALLPAKEVPATKLKASPCPSHVPCRSSC